MAPKKQTEPKQEKKQPAKSKAAAKTPEKVKQPKKALEKGKTVKKTESGKKTSPAAKGKKAASGSKKKTGNVEPVFSGNRVQPSGELLPEQGRKERDPALRRSIARRTTNWKSGKTGFILRWLAMIPLAFVWYVFTFLMAGYSFSALVCLALIGILLFYNVCYLARGRYPRLVRVVKRVFTCLLCVGVLVVGITECFIIHASLGDKNESCEYMLVLGAKVRQDGPSVSLMDRIRAAADYMNAHPEVIAVVSGGQGPDEPMTEAQCMYEQLVKLGIDPNRIWLEDKATSTWENLRFTLDLIKEKTGQRPDKIGLLSSEYHLFRAGLFADACGVDAVGIPAKTSRLSQKINHFMREVAGVWHYLLLGGQYSD